MDFFRKLKKAFWVSRPLFWIGPMAAYKAGLWLAGVPMGTLEWVELFLLSFPLSLVIYGTNDIYDRESDRKNPRKSVPIWGEKLSDEDIPWLKNWCLSSALLILLAALSTLNLFHISFAILGLATAYFYSAPPLRLKERPILDSLSAVGYGLFAFGMGYSLSGSIDFLDWKFLLLCLNLSAFHAIGTIMDMGEDKKMGVRTFSTVLGGRAAALFSSIIFLLNIALIHSYSSAAPTMALIVEISLLFAAFLSLWLAIRPSPKNAKLAFKLLIAYGMAWGYFLILYYFLNGRHFLQDEFIQAFSQLLRVR